MSKDIARRGDLPIKKNTLKELAEIRDDMLTAQAVVQAQENVTAHQAHCKIENGYGLADRTIRSATQLNRSVTHASRDNPSLEMTLRGIEEDVSVAARTIIYRYMTRP